MCLSGQKRLTEPTIPRTPKRSRKTGGLEETLASIEAIPHLDPARLLSHLATYGRQVLYQKTGYLLSQFNNTLRLPESFFTECHSHVGKSVRYLDEDLPANNRDYDPHWQLVVPQPPSRHH